MATTNKAPERGRQIRTLINERKAISDKIRVLEDKEFEEKATAIVGRYYMQTESYGGPSAPWIIYRRFDRFEDRNLIAFSFSDDGTGLIRIDSNERKGIDVVLRCKEITEEEFVAAWGALVASLTTRKLQRAPVLKGEVHERIN